jgi:hypothetical protein
MRGLTDTRFSRDAQLGSKPGLAPLMLAYRCAGPSSLAVPGCTCAVRAPRAGRSLDVVSRIGDDLGLPPPTAGTRRRPRTSHRTRAWPARARPPSALRRRLRSPATPGARPRAKHTRRARRHLPLRPPCSGPCLVEPRAEALLEAGGAHRLHTSSRARTTRPATSWSYGSTTPTPRGGR